nr:hypothetical protein BaRGS_008735 [Batillaria attramentaria]
MKIFQTVTVFIQKLKKKAKKLKKKKRMLEERLDEKKQQSGQEEEGADEESEEPLVTPRLMRLRRTLPALQAAEEVLARFRDDGWYYRGTVQQNLGDCSYIVEDATGYIERIWREDIISDYDDNAPPLKEDDRVVALHPCHTASYAPGCVCSVDEVRQTAEVQFYDGHKGDVPRVEVYRLPRENAH